MTTGVLCPSREQLSAFHFARLPEAEMRQVAKHVAQCQSCQAQLDQFALTTGELVASLGKPRPADATVNDAALHHLQQTATPTPNAIVPVVGSLLAPPQAADEIGRLGGYLVRQQLGAGGMGVVYRAEDPQLRRPVALKVMNPMLAQNPAAMQRFLREARAVAALTHDHIVSIYQVGQDQGVSFLAMQLLEGEALEDRLEREAPLPTAEVLRIGREAAEGLAAAHERGLIHRDIKPANMWLEAPSGRVKILDFGLACEQNEDAKLTQTGNVLGTPAYMSPEQARSRTVDPRSDLFSLGCVLYQLCTGVSPFQRPSAFDTLLAVTEEEPAALRTVAPKLPPALAALIHQMLAKEPAARPVSASEVCERLRQIEAALTRRPRLGLGGLAAALLTGLLTLASGGVAVAVLNQRPAPTPIIVSTPEPTVVTQVIEKPKKLTPKTPDVDNGWVKKTAALPVHRRYQAVVAKLRELNPEFKGEVHRTLDLSASKILTIAIITDDVTNLSPLQALTDLQVVRCSGSKPGEGTLSDLSPLQGLKLKRLECKWNIIVDYTPLKDVPLETVECDFEAGRDTEVFRSIKTLKRINGKSLSDLLRASK